MFSVAPVWAESLNFQALLNPDGSGRLFVNNGSDPEWESCKPDLSACSPFAIGGDISTDGAAPETVFWGGGKGFLSPIWYGNVSSITAPSVSGEMRANEVVTPILGEWQGGWEGDFDQTQLAACVSPVGEDCITLTHTHYVDALPDGAALIDPAFTGRYLRVADRRLGPGTAEAAYGLSSPYTRETWPPNSVTSVAMVGQIASATSPRKIWLGPPPLIRASISKRGVATVRCEVLACRAVLIARRGRHRARTVRKLPAVTPKVLAKELPRLRLRHRARVRLGSGRVRVIVKVNGLRMAQRRVRLGAFKRRKATG